MRATLAMLMAVLLALAAAALAAVDLGEEDEEEDAAEDEDKERGEEDDEKRKVEIDVSGDEAKIELKRETKAAEDKVEMSFDASEAEIEVKFEAEEGDTETEQKLEAEFVQLLEYVDGDANGRFDAGEEVASSWLLSSEGEDGIEDAPVSGNVDWGALTVSDETSADGTPGKRISGRATFGGTGVFGLDLHVFGDFTEFAGATLEPTEVKIDIRIDGYPFERDGSALALVLETKAESEFEREHEDIEEGEEGVAAADTVAGKRVSLVFTWTERATVDGVEQPVGTTVLKSEEEREVEEGEEEFEEKRLFVLSYARGASVVHDPTAGVSYEPAGGIPAPATGLVLVVAALAAGLRRARRW